MNKNKISKKKINSILVLIGLLLGILTSIFIVWDRYKQKPSGILLEPLVLFQTAFDIKPKQHLIKDPGPELEIAWKAYFSIVNISNEVIVIEDISFYLPSDKSIYPAWGLVQKNHFSSSISGAYVINDENILFEQDSTTSFDSFYKSTPFILQPGSENVYIFPLSFDIYKGKQKIIPMDLDKTLEFVQGIFGARKTSEGNYLAVWAQIKVIMKIAQKGEVIFEPETFLFFENSFFYVPK